MKAAVGYLRTSGEINPKTSIPNQREAVKGYCGRNSYLLRKIFVDECKTGTKVEGRDGYAELLATVESESISTIVVVNFDRLSRQSIEFVKTVTILKRKGIEVISIQQHQNTLYMNSVQIVMAGLQAEIDNKTRIERLKDGRNYARSQGKFNSNILPFGYQLSNDRSLVLNDKEAQIVKTIFLEFQNHKNFKKVCAIINERFAVVKNGLSIGRVKKILSNPVYIGKDCEAVDDGTGQCMFQLISMAEHEQIISEKMFCCTFNYLAEKSQSSKPKAQGDQRTKYLANNIIFCVICEFVVEPYLGKYKCRCKKTFYDVEQVHSSWINCIDKYVSQSISNQNQRAITLLLEKKEKNEIQFATCKITKSKYEENIQSIQRQLTETEDKGEIDGLKLALKSLKGAIKGEKRKEIRKIIKDNNLNFSINPEKQIIFKSNKTLP